MTRASCLQLLRDRHAAWMSKECDARGIYARSLAWLFYGMPFVLLLCCVAMFALGFLGGSRPSLSVLIIGVLMVISCGTLARCGVAIMVIATDRPDLKAETAALATSQYESLIAIGHEIKADPCVFVALIGASDELERITHPNVTKEAKQAVSAVRFTVYDELPEERN